MKFRYVIIDALAQSIARGDDVDSQIAELKTKAKVAEDYYLLAKVYQYAQDADSSLTNYEKATMLDPKNAVNTPKITACILSASAKQAKRNKSFARPNHLEPMIRKSPARYNEWVP